MQSNRTLPPQRNSNLWEPSLDTPAHLMEKTSPSHAKVQRHHSAAASSTHRPRPSIKTDYPVNVYSYQQDSSVSEADGRVGGGYRLPRRNSNLSYSSDSGGLLRGRTDSMDRNSYSGSQSSFNGSLPEPGYSSRHGFVPESGYRMQSTESAYRGPPTLLLDTGTPNSSQSDFSSKRYSATMPRPQSTISVNSLEPGVGRARDRGRPVSTLDRKQKGLSHPSSATFIATAGSWPLDEDDEGTPQRLGAVSHTDEYHLMRHFPAPYYQPQSPSTPSFSSDDDVPWYEQEEPRVGTSLWPGGLPNGRAPYGLNPAQSPSQLMPHYNPYPGHPYSTEQYSMQQQRLERYFSQSSTLDDDSSSMQSYDSSIGPYPGHLYSQPQARQQRHRRVSSPPFVQYGTELIPPPQGRLYSDSERSSLTGDTGSITPQPGPSSTPKARLGLSKLTRKLGLRSDKREAAENGVTGEDEEKKKKKKKKKRMLKSVSSSTNLDHHSSVKRSLSMEQLHLSKRTPGTPQLTKRKTAPYGSPRMTPRSRRRFGLSRRNSEPDLEAAINGQLVRSGSKRNLMMDPTEALFEAIELDDFDKCERLISDEAANIDLNHAGEDELTPLDLAVMLPSSSIASLLLSHGARDSTKYYRDPQLRYKKVSILAAQAYREAQAIGELIAANGATGTSKEMDRQLQRWKRKAEMWNRMASNIDKAKPPGSPRDVTLIVSSNRSLTVRFSPPDNDNGSAITRYKIQWSRTHNFVPEVGEFVMCDVRSREYTIPDLIKGDQYYVRVFAFNLKGFGQPQPAMPAYAVPSNWRDSNDGLAAQPRYQGCTTQMQIIAAEFNMALSSLKQMQEQQQEQQQLVDTTNAANFGAPALNNRKSLKKGITKFFSQGVKFHKNLKAGVYLAGLVYSDEGRVLVTVDDHIPILEVSDSNPTSLGSDFAWLAKVACTWEQVREMAEMSDSYTSSPAILFRNKLLHAVMDLQSATGLQDLGLLHHKPYQDSHGALVFVLVQYVEDYKCVFGANVKWSSLTKLRRKVTSSDSKPDTLTAPEQLIQDTEEIISHRTKCSHELPKGLYLAYLKARSSLASMTIVTSGVQPNVLPNELIRPCANLSLEEWSWLQSLIKEGSEVSNIQSCQTSYGEQSLQRKLYPAIENFLKKLNIPEKDISDHQLYIEEVIELNENTAFLLLLPPPDLVCTPPGSTDQFVGSNFTHLPISNFELLQLYTYQRNFITKFTTVSTQLDLELLVSQKRMREAFSKSEVAAVKRRHEDLQNFHEKTEQVWKQMRWIETALQTARDYSLEKRLTVAGLREAHKSVSSHPVSSSASSLSSGQLSPLGISAPSRTSLTVAQSSRYIRVFPKYDTGLAEGTSVKIYIHPSTTTAEVIRTAVEQLEKTRLDHGIPGQRIHDRDLPDFYLLSTHNHRDERILPKNFTPFELLNLTGKYRFYLRRWSLDQQTTEV